MLDASGGCELQGIDLYANNGYCQMHEQAGDQAQRFSQAPVVAVDKVVFGATHVPVLPDAIQSSDYACLHICSIVQAIQS